MWDLREKHPVNKIQPFENDKICRPELGKWIGAVSLNEDWLVSLRFAYLIIDHFRVTFLHNVYV